MGRPSNEQTMELINPATGESLGQGPRMELSEAKAHARKAHEAFLDWRRVAFSERATSMRRAAGILRRRAAPYAELMTREMGKPIRDGRAEVEKCAWVCDYYADNAATFLSNETIQSDATKSFVTFQPLGVVLAIMPWNFPFWQVFRFAAPGLMAGNAAVLKHASNVPGSAAAIEEVFRDAGFPDGLFCALYLDGAETEQLIAADTIAAVTLTGSTAAGRAVASAAGRALKKSVLELGGSDAYVVCGDADVEAAAKTCATSRLINTGQSCIAAKRFIVVSEVRERFEAAVVEHMSAAQLGDPMLEETVLGPMARIDLRDELHEQVRASIERGAKLLLGGEVPERSGAWYPATVLADVSPGMPAYEEELFGPVAAIIEAGDEDDAIRIANDSVFGLGAAVFTQDVARGTRIAETYLDAGSCFVNTLVRSDPRLPFGGIKESGYGRELSSFGIRELVNIKTVYVA